MHFIDKIIEDVMQQIKFEPYDSQMQEHVAKYIKNKYPGNYRVEVAEDMIFSIVFDTKEDVTLFILKYS